jgi:hypothetical protein
MEIFICPRKYPSIEPSIGLVLHLKLHHFAFSHIFGSVQLNVLALQINHKIEHLDERIELAFLVFVAYLSTKKACLSAKQALCAQEACLRVRTGLPCYIGVPRR